MTIDPFTSRDGFRIRNVYIDESSQTKARFLVLGGITLQACHAVPFETFVRWKRHPELPSSEMKWTKVSRTKLPAYERVVTEFFDPPPALPESIRPVGSIAAEAAIVGYSGLGPTSVQPLV